VRSGGTWSTQLTALAQRQGRWQVLPTHYSYSRTWKMASHTS